MSFDSNRFPKGSRREKAVTFTRAFGLALLDSNETQQLLVGEELSSIRRIERLVPQMKASPEGRRVMTERPVISNATIDFEDLRTLPDDTLGGAFARHLRRNHLDPDALLVPVTRSKQDDANYLLERIRQTHDLWHTLLGLDTQAHEEVLVHAFQWSQLKMPYSALVVSFGSLKHFVGERRFRDLRNRLPLAFIAGRRAAPLLPVFWEEHFETPLDTLRARYRITPLG